MQKVVRRPAVPESVGVRLEDAHSRSDRICRPRLLKVRSAEGPERNVAFATLEEAAERATEGWELWPIQQHRFVELESFAGPLQLEGGDDEGTAGRQRPVQGNPE